MVDVAYQPIKKIIVHEVLKQSLDDFIRMKAQPAPNGMPPMPVRWIDGIVFTFNGMPATPEMINERVRDGTVHWDFVEFAEMQNYQKVLFHPETNVPLSIVDNSNNTAVSDVIRWLKKQRQWSSTTDI